MSELPRGEHRSGSDPLVVDLPLELLRSSGLLWKINRDVLHPLGLALGASAAPKGAVLLDVRIAADGLWEFAAGLTRADDWDRWYAAQRALMVESPPDAEEHDRIMLIGLCRRGLVPQSKWSNRDSASSQIKIAKAGALLAAGCEFEIRRTAKYERDGCVSDDRMWWVDITWRGFDAFEYGMDEGASLDTFYIPTQARLDEVAGADWYC